MDNFKPMAWLFPVLGLAVAARLFNLDQIEPFYDEVFHIVGAAKLKEVPVYEGKYFGYLLFSPISNFSLHPLHMARLLVAICGVLTTLGIFLSAMRLGGVPAAMASGLIWALMPIITFHDRMALFDPINSLFLVWSFYFLILSMTGGGWRSAFAGGFSLGLAIAVKVVALIGVIWLASFAFLFLNKGDLSKYKSRINALLFGLAIPISGVAYLVLSNISLFEKFLLQFMVDKDMAASAASSFRLARNLEFLVDWFVKYNSVYFTIFTFLIIVISIWRSSKLKSALILSFLIPLVLYMSIFSTWFPRYLSPLLVPLVLLFGVVCSEWKRPAGKVSYVTSGLLAILLLMSAPRWIMSNIKNQQNPVEATMPDIDRRQYFDGYYSGDGLRSVATFLKTQDSAYDQNSLLVTAEGYDIMHEGLSLLLRDTPTIEMMRATLRNKGDYVPIMSASEKKRTLFLVVATREKASYFSSFLDPTPKLIFNYERVKAGDGFWLFEVGRNSAFKSDAF